jgi:type I restriction enzyme R subunit
LATIPSTVIRYPIGEGTIGFEQNDKLPASPTITQFACPKDDEAKAKLSLELDRTMREKAPAGWKGDDTREKQVLNALYPIMSRDRQATQAIFELIKNQPGY